MTKNKTTMCILAAAVALLIGAALASAKPASTLHAARTQTTSLISRARDGGTPNGPSTNPVISGDRRYARVIAFESEASDLVSGDTNGMKDVFAVKRTGSFANTGTSWHGGNAILLSRGLNGQPANGPSFSPSVDGAYRSAPRCVAFLSAASNLVGGDTNGVVDAFVSRGPGGTPKRVSLPGGHQASAATTAVAVSGNCSHLAFVTDGKLYDRVGRHTRSIATTGTPANPSFAAGEGNDLVFDARDGIYLSSNGTGRPHLVASGGRNPAYNALKRRVVTYEKQIGGHWQIAWRDLGQGERVASSVGSHMGNGDSRDPVVANSGYYIGFETEANNLGTNAARDRRDNNDLPDTYLYTGVRDLTLVQDVKEYGVPVDGGGRHPSISYYANYFVFDSPAPLGNTNGERQVFMRWLGGV
jgi:hypothetical protein